MGESKTTTLLFVFLLMLTIGMGLEIYNHPSEYNMNWLNSDLQYQKDLAYEYEQSNQNGGFLQSLNDGINGFIDTIVSPVKIAQLFVRALLRSVIPYSLQVGTLETVAEQGILYILQFFQLGIYLVQGITIWRIFRRD